MLKLSVKSRRLLSATLVIIISLTILPNSLAGCSKGPESVTLAAVPTELNALVYIAQVQNFFTDAGLVVVLKDYDSGAAATAGMLKGEAEMALAAEFPIARQVFNKQDIINFATITKYENTFFVWRADNGIRTITDLKGKKIGVTLQTISEFYLGRSLELNDMSIKDVTLVNIKAPDIEQALINRDVDAVVTWDPWVHNINLQLGDAAVTTAAQSSQYAYWNLISTTQWSSNHSKTIQQVLKALDQAEKFMVEHPDESRTIVREWMNFDESFINAIWPRYQFSLSLGQSLITAMEDEARWMMVNGLTTEKNVPDFLSYVNEKALKAIKPEAVEIIR